MGMAAAGKSQLIDVIAGLVKPVMGSVVLAGAWVAAGPPSGRRPSPLQIARQVAGRKADSGQLVQALSALGLWEVKETPVTSLSPGQVMACDLLPCLLFPAEIILIDGHLDALDPWIRESAIEFLEDRARTGAALVISTNHAAVAERLGSVIVLKEQQARFAGTIRELKAAARPAELEIETDDETTVAAMADPFVLQVRSSEQGLVLSAPDGQTLAAKLLTEGYGRVKCVVLREPSTDEALLSIL